MNLLSFRYFLEVSRHLNFTKASEKLRISQPGLSQQITALENELGVKLLNRTTRKVTLTEEGEYLYKKLSPLFENIERTANELTEKKVVPQTTVKIAAVPSAASLYLPQMLTMLHKEFPDVEFYLQETTSTQAIELINRQKSHIAYIRTPKDTATLKRQGFNFIELERYPLQLIVAKSHPAAHQKTVDLKELQHEKFIHYDRQQSPALYDLLEQACLVAGFRPKTFCVGPEILTIASLVANGLGVTLIPQDMATLLDSSKVSAVNLTQQTLHSSISIIWRNSDYVPLITQTILRLVNREQAPSATG